MIETVFEITVKNDEIIDLDNKIDLERFLKEKLQYALKTLGISVQEITTDSYSKNRS